jgi:phospholipase C
MTADQVTASPPRQRNNRANCASAVAWPRRRLGDDAVCYLAQDTDEVWLRLIHDGPEPARMVVFSYAGGLAEPAHVEVRGTVEFHVPTPRGFFDLVVVGPDGFRREHRGSVVRPSGAYVSARSGPRPEQVRLLLHNHGANALSYVVAPGAYASSREPLTVSVAPQMTRSLTWDVIGSRGWYDVSVSVAGAPAFASRLIGHLGWLPG